MQNAANKTVRDAAKRAGVRLWQIADHIGMNDGNFSRKLRRELPMDEQRKLLDIIDVIAAENKEAS